MRSDSSGGTFEFKIIFELVTGLLSLLSFLQGFGTQLFWGHKFAALNQYPICFTSKKMKNLIIQLLKGESSCLKLYDSKQWAENVHRRWHSPDWYRYIILCLNLESVVRIFWVILWFHKYQYLLAMIFRLLKRGLWLSNWKTLVISVIHINKL